MVQLFSASNQWATRPADERFLDLQSLFDAVNARRDHSREVPRINLKGLHIGHDDDGAMYLRLAGGQRAMFNHWSFSQLCSLTGTPAAYMRQLEEDPDLVERCVERGLQKTDKDSKMLWNPPNGQPGVVRAFNGVDYGRIWDSQLAGLLLDRFGNDEHWGVPLEAYGGVNSIQATTLFAGDRDIFCFLTDETRPIEVNGTTLYRGFYTWNSETGRCVWGLTTFLFDRVCANRIIWGAQDVREIRVRHSKNAPLRFEDEAVPALSAISMVSQASPSNVIDMVRKAQATRLAKDSKATEEWLVERKFPAPQVTKAMMYAADETGQYGSHGDPLSIWNLVAGGTAAAREIPYSDQRTTVEQRWSSLLNETGVTVENGLVTLEATTV